jgi:hypothetical protein
MWADLLDRHRAEWVASLAGDRDVTSLDGEGAPDGTLVWLDRYPGGVDRGDVGARLRALAAEGRPVVVGLPADAGGAAAREAERLASELGGVTLAQHLAAGSLIAGEAGDARDVVHFLVCVNVDVARAEAASSATDAEVVPLMRGYVSFLEEANRSLSEANARLARERLGAHDSAAAAAVAELQREVERQRAIADDKNNQLIQAHALLASPRYRAVDKLREVVFGLPGISTLFERRSRMIQERGRQP